MTFIFKNMINLILTEKCISYQIRFYPRWSHRRPVRTYTPEEYEEVEKTVKNVSSEKNLTTNKDEIPLVKQYSSTKIQWAFNKGVEGVKNKIKTVKEPKPLLATNQKTNRGGTNGITTDMFETVIDKDGNLIYTKMANNDDRVGKILTEVKSKKEKHKNDLALLEGKRLIKDALLSGCTLKYILFSRKQDVEDLKPYLPKTGAQLYKMPYREMQLWTDLTTTPGVMAIIKIPDTENNVVNERLPITVVCDNIREPGNLGTILRICAGVGCKSVILTTGCVNLWDTKVLRSASGAHFKLQIHRNVDWNLLEEKLSNTSNIFVADNKIITEAENTSVEQSQNNIQTFLEKIPLLPYYSVDFGNSKELVIIVGSETLGISENSYKIALEHNGVRLNIPLNNCVDSLNVGTALGIIAFEMKKQLLMCKPTN